MSQADIGLIGLAVMGENLVLNLANHGYEVVVTNRTTSKIDAFLSGRAKGKTIRGVYSNAELAQALKRPRRILIMVKAGVAVDRVIEALIPVLEPGDIVIDGGNSYFEDSIRRSHELAKVGLLFVGAGISGGEEGALEGPSIMPGGSVEAWESLKDLFQCIAAKVEGGQPCCDWVGADGAGHYVKMVHNGIEYGDMQMICEAYDLMRRCLGLSPESLHAVFKKWNEGELNSYLIEITANIFSQRDQEKGLPLVDLILDTAGQKGTGKWTSQQALEMGAPTPTVAEATFARCISFLKEERERASKVLIGPNPVYQGDKDAFINAIGTALFASKICSYAQGFQLLRMAAEKYTWELNYGNIAQSWRGGCIIRAQFLTQIKEVFDSDPNLPNLLLAPYFKRALDVAQESWRHVVATACRLGIPVPAFGSALSYYDAYRAERLPSNLLQAQRDYFGAHTYERIDRPRGVFFHTDWTGRGGSTSSSTYSV